MPGQGRSRYYWSRYYEQKAIGKSDAYAAEVAAIVEKRHKAKQRRKRK